MKHVRTAITLAIALTIASVTSSFAQDFVTPAPQILPPPPPAPPPPRFEVPRVPQMDEVPSSPKAALPRRKSFDKRVTDCIQEGTGGPNERAAYSRACAN
jgi:hypothetical protein